MPKLPPPPAEPPRHVSLDELAPKFRAKILLVLAELRERGFDPFVFEALRSQDRQEWLHGFGRQWTDGRANGGTVTALMIGWHLYGTAVDIIDAKKGWDNAAFFNALGEAGERQGLVWGGRWRSRDAPHLQLGSPMRSAPTQKSAQLVASGGLVALWRYLGAA